MTGRAVLVCCALVAIAGCGKKARSYEDAGAGSARPILSDGGLDRAAITAEYDRSCVAGDFEACRNLGAIYQGGLGVVKDARRATALFAQACNGGNVASCNHLAVALAQGMGVQRDAAKAAELYQKACDGGHNVACNNLGLMLMEGDGVPKDLARAELILEKACAANTPFACTNAGNLDAKLLEQEGAPRRKKMLGHFGRGCDAKDPTSCRAIGVLYLKGLGLPPSPSAAGIWLKKGCDHGDGEACRVLGFMHRDGHGVARDLDRSAQLLKRACERRDDEACKHLTSAGSGSSLSPNADAGVTSSDALNAGSGNAQKRPD